MHAYMSIEGQLFNYLLIEINQLSLPFVLYTDDGRGYDTDIVIPIWDKNDFEQIIKIICQNF